MKTKLLAAAACAVLLTGPALGQEQEILGNDDIIALTDAGLTASVIVAKIQGSKTNFDTSVEKLVELASAGVEGPVIEAMMNAGPTAAQPAKDLKAQAGASLRETSSSPERTAQQPGDTFSDALSGGGRGPEMVVLPAGSFRMGCVSGLNCYDYELPVHMVTIRRPVAVSKYEVTFEDYDRFTQPNKVEDQGWGRGRRPVINASWG